ncbi:MAG: cyclic nucleotide-binding domain-containing protein [Acidobacteria bacterium]|nr:cyclic nucleotide-binding domain-containing protein [Acidobacteriota bacterium]MCA1610591.1 cyclic nucleotide-binding domain-containing protein [Acidobacteriota bacterium]
MKAVFKAGTGGGRSPFERYVATHPMGEIIFSEGEIGTEMYIIQSGVVELFKSIGGEARVLSTLEKGDFFGEMSVLEDLPRTASARAKTDVEVVRINGAMFDTMLKSNTEIAIRMMRKLSRRLRDVSAALEEALGQKTAAAPEGRPAMRKAGPKRDLYRLVSPEGGAEFFLNREGDTLVGRADPVTGITPDVDLTNLDGQRSTSRRHAKLYQMGGVFYIMEEIGVMNGTFVNDKRLATGAPAAVNHGDILKFGLVPLTFYSAES